MPKRFSGFIATATSMCSGETPHSVEGLVGVTAIMLAILPIRAVLVPSEISSLTLVDFFLAFEMAALAAGAVLVYIWAPVKKRSSAAAPPAA